MIRKLLFFLGAAAAIHAEVHVLTLRQAVAIALTQNPDVVIARLDRQKAEIGVRAARDPFVPKVYAGSGLAWTYGYPNSIEGSAPSIVQVRTDMALFNRPRSFDMAQARETARGAAVQSQSTADEAAFRAATLFLDAAGLMRSLEIVRRQAEGLERLRQVAAARLAEGRELPLAVRRAEVDLARARQRIETLAGDSDYAQGSLALALGFAEGDRVAPAPGEEDSGRIAEKEQPASEEEAVAAALRDSKELKVLESRLQAKGMEARSQRATRLPQLDLVAQYALFAKQNYQGYFQKFQRNNAQLGVAITVPILTGSAAGALAAQADVDLAKLRQQSATARTRIALEARRAFHDIRNAESARALAKLDLEVAREQVSVLLAQSDEGRASAQQVQQGKIAEDEKWIAFYDAGAVLGRARLNLLRETGALLAALR